MLLRAACWVQFAVQCEAHPDRHLLSHDTRSVSLYHLKTTWRTCHLHTGHRAQHSKDAQYSETRTRICSYRCSQQPGLGWPTAPEPAAQDALLLHATTKRPVHAPPKTLFTSHTNTRQLLPLRDDTPAACCCRTSTGHQQNQLTRLLQQQPCSHPLW